LKNAYDFRDSVPAYIRPLFVKGKGPSGGRRFPGSLRTSRDGSARFGLFPQNEQLARWIKLAQSA